MGAIFHYAPRVLGIVGILFLSLFALDVFSMSAPWHRILLGFLIHMIPNFVLIGLLVLAWNHERIGGALFVAAGLMPLCLLSNPFWVNLMLGGPFILTGLLFWLSSWWGQRPAGA